MQVFMQPLENLTEYQEIRSRLPENRGVLQLSGCVESQKAHMMYGLFRGMKNDVKKENLNCLIIAENDLKAREIYEDYRMYDQEVFLYPAKDLIFFQADVHGNLLTRERMRAVAALLENKGATVITSMGGCMDYLLPLEVIREHTLVFKNDSPVDLEKLRKQLLSMGYEGGAQAESPGQFSVRGGIIDIFPLTLDNPVRIELWGDEIDSIRSFDPESQRSIENLEEVTIYPAAEMILDEDVLEKGLKAMEKEKKDMVKKFRENFLTEEGARLTHMVDEAVDSLKEYQDFSAAEHFVRYFYKNPVTFLDYFPAEDTLIFLDETNRLTEQGNAIETEFRESMEHRLEKGYLLAGQTDLLMPCRQVIQNINKKNCVSLCTIEQQRGDWEIREQFYITVKSVSPYNNSFELLVKDMEYFKKNGYQVLLLSGSRTRASRLAKDLSQEGLNSFYTEDMDRIIAPGEIMTAFGHAKRGFEYPLIKFVVITESDIFGQEKKKKRKKTEYSGKRIQNFSELSIGDYVVHENHGLGIYRGIEKITVDRVAKDYIKIEYGDNSTLYILPNQLDLLQKYAGADAKAPKLNKLGTQDWNKTKTKVKGAVKNIARDLVQLYAARQAQSGYQYGPDTVWQREFEEMFPFEETEDQLAAIDAAKKDMESTKIMDRLICGDVGYGKTEIAIRAAFKAVQESKQVVYLVPTTILAQQHYNTFVQRMKDFPVRIDLLCRFRTPAEQKKTIEDLGKGLVDIVIGTHRVLSKDVKYKDLGLLIIDEEQRFGVTHKEKIKKLKENVDVLTLTATPIPRTLHMSLIGIRDMSVLEEAPMDRMPIQTYVMEYNEELVREAITREMARGGQVYYVYNRVNDIQEITNRIAKLVPEANVAFAHGQMREHQLEKIMYGFINGDIDVLVSTTIIETGLDISNANTMIVHDADQMGLSQLYQLRGRVGRSNRTAYAFLMYRRNKMLKEVAEKRLHAIREFTDLGSGFKIAMRDLEIRGAGNLLGAEQHGHMQAVGYDLYCKMLDEAVKEAKGIRQKEEFETTVDLELNAFIPPKYIPNEYQKLDVYKRIAGIESQEEYEDMLEELMDRFGEPPKAVENLLAIAALKALAHKVYITEIKQTGKDVKLTMFRHAKLNPSGFPEILNKYKNNLKMHLEEPPYFQASLKGRKPKETLDVLETLNHILTDFLSLVEE